MPVVASLEVFHSRPATPVRRVAIGHAELPVDPAPGYGPLLLAGTLAHHLALVDEDWHDDIDTLIDEVRAGRRIAQPRLRHRLEVARHGLARSTQRLVIGVSGRPDDVEFRLECNGTPMQQVLAPVYALGRLPVARRSDAAELLVRATRWTGPLGPGFVSFLGAAGRLGSGSLTRDVDPVRWALDQLGLDIGSGPPAGDEVQRRFREMLRRVHPDTGGDPRKASDRIAELGEARRILLR